MDLDAQSVSFLMKKRKRQLVSQRRTRSTGALRATDFRSSVNEWTSPVGLSSRKQSGQGEWCQMHKQVSATSALQ